MSELEIFFKIFPSVFVTGIHIIVYIKVVRQYRSIRPI